MHGWRNGSEELIVLRSIEDTLKRMERKLEEKKMGITEAEFDAALDELVGKIAEGFDEVKKAIAALQAKIDQGASQVDLSDELQKVKDATAAVASAVAEIQSGTTDTPPAA